MDSVSDALQVSCGAVLGVLTRVGLGRGFGPSGADVVSSYSALFSDLPANAVGCLLAGLFAPMRARAAGVHHSLPHAISTGYFGSLTTFASWNLQATRMFVNGDVAAALLSLVLGILVPFSCYSIGGDIFRMSSAILDSKKGRSSRETSRNSTASICDATNEPGGTSSAKVLGSGVGVGGNGVDLVREDTGPVERRGRVLIFTALFLSGLLAASGAAYGLDKQSTLDESTEWRRTLWLSCLLAPIGALCRWQLSRLNGGVPRVPCGTLAANSLAALLDAAIAAGLSRVTDVPATEVGLSAIITGVGGTLSTVSTWAGEVHALRSAGSEHRAYAYTLASVVIAQALGLVVYGTVVWTD